MTTPQANYYENWKRYAGDPWAFLMECVYTLDQVNKGDPIKTLPNREYAKMYCQLWLRCPLMAIPKSRRMTMSWFTIGLYLWDTLFHDGRFNAFVSKKEDDANELVERAKFIYDHIPQDKLPREMLPEAHTKFCLLEFPEIKSKIQGFPQGADQLRQFTFSGIFGDESAFWPDAKAFYSASFPTIDGGGRMTLVSSPAPGFFKQLCFDTLDSNIDVNVSTVKVDYENLMQGVRVWRNKKNKFVVMELHFTADPLKRDEAYRESIKNAMPLVEFMREYDLHWDTFSGYPVYPEFSKLHVLHKAPYPMAGLPMVVGVDFGLCYDDKTEILTEKSGWKLMKDVGAEESVGTLDPVTFELKFQVPKFKVDMPFKGNMISYDGNSCNFMVTPDHIMPTWYDKHDLRRYYAKDLAKSPRHKYIRLTANWQGEDTPNELGLHPLVYAGLMGAYLSEGCVEPNRIFIAQTKDKTWLADIIAKTEWNWKDVTTGFRLNNTTVAQHFIPFGHQDMRYIPEEIKNGSREVMLEFIRAYTLGDGHIRIRDNGASEHTLFTCSKQMAADMQEIALKIGWDSSCRYVKPTESYMKAENRIIKSNGGYSITFKKRTSWAELVKDNFKSVPYDGRVYCFSVKDNILCTRREGYVHFNGNTPAAVIGQFQEETLVIFEELVEVNMGSDRFAQKLATLIKLKYRTHSDLRKNWLCFIDPAGLQRNQKDETSCALSLMSVGFAPAPGPIIWEQRRKGVVEFLKRMTKDGPGFQIYGRECPVTLKGFEGGYRYSDKAVEIEPNQVRPVKDAHSHPHDALQYLCCGIADKVTQARRAVPRPVYSISEKKAQVTHG